MEDEQDAFNAAGRRHHKGAAANTPGNGAPHVGGKHHGKHKKVIEISGADQPAGTATDLIDQMADAAKTGQISRQAQDGWSGIDGFDNASGKRLSTGMKAGLIAVATLALAGMAYLIITHLEKKKG